MKWKTLLILASLLICSGLGAPQPSQDMPHRVFGTVEDMQGSTITDSEVEVVYDGDKLASDTTDSDGYYDITVPYGEEYGEGEVQIQVEENQADAFDYQSGEVEEIDLTVETTQKQEEQEDSPSSGGPAGGSFTEDSNQENQETNETENTQDPVSETNETSEEDEEASPSNETDTGGNQTENNQTSDETTNFITGLFASEPSVLGGFLSSIMESISSFISNLF